MTTRGLWALTGAANTLQAWEDWDKLACEAVDMGLADQANRLEPYPQDGWRKIDKQIAKLRKVIQRHSTTTRHAGGNEIDL